MADTGEAFVDRLRAATDRILALQPRVEEGCPWPLAERFGTEPEAVWGPMEVLAHSAEMLPFWLGEIARILAGDPEPVPFGRIADDPTRLAIIERDRSLPPGELFDRIASDTDRYGRRLQELAEPEFGRRGLHPRRGDMTVADVLERFVVGHLEEHGEQLTEALAARR
jgi:DinB superfamily